MVNKDGGGEGGGWQKDEDEVQAIIIADSFNVMFSPITHELPRALIPLGNSPLIDYTIQYLLEQSVHEIIIFCCSHGEKIREHVRTRWIKDNSKVIIHCVMSSTSDCISFGDALREIDREGLIRSDFILVPGDLLSNIKLPQLVKEHKAKRKKEKNIVMTTLHRTANPNHFSRSQEDDVVLTLEPTSNRVMHWQKPHNTSKFCISTSNLCSKSINVRYDLSNCHIFICSPQVAPLFTDNFDYQTLDDFVKGILINEEIMGDQIHACILEDGYSARVNDLHMYNAISQDYVNHWVYPLTPTSVISKRNYVYINEHVQIGKNCELKSSIIIGANTSIGENVKINKSMIGANCKIGSNVCIENSYIWDGATIENDVDIKQTVVCNNAHIQKSSKMIDCLISFGVVVGSDQILPPSTRLSMIHPNDNEVEENFDNGLIMHDNKKPAKTGYDIEAVGVNGKGYCWPHLEDEEDIIIPSLTGNNYDDSTDEESSDEEFDDSAPPSPPNELSNFHQFQIEVFENMRCGILENIDHDNIALEINASKFKFNITITELCTAVMQGLLKLVIKDENTPKQEIIKEFEKTSTSLLSLLLKYYNTAETQMYAIKAAEDYFASCTSLSSLFATVLHQMYEKDILNENVILHWYKTPSVVDDTNLQNACNLLRQNQNMIKFMTWLEEAEEEDSDDQSD